MLTIEATKQHETEENVTTEVIAFELVKITSTPKFRTTFKVTDTTSMIDVTRPYISPKT